MSAATALPRRSLTGLKTEPPRRFNLVMYVVILDEQFGQKNAFKLSQSLRDFVGGVDAGQPGASLTAEDVASGKDLLDWVQDGVIDAVFSDAKYNDDKMALWERNYLGRYNKVIGGVFLRQHRYVRADPESPGQGPCTSLLPDVEAYHDCLKENQKCGSEKFSGFYPVCFTDWSPESGKPIPYGPLYERKLEEKLFRDSVVTQAALGEDTTQEEMCQQLVTENGGKFCVSCLSSVSIPGVPPFQVYGVGQSDESDCLKCKKHCLLEVAPAVSPTTGTDIGVLLPEQVCGMCTFEAKATAELTFGENVDPAEHYQRGFLEVDKSGQGHLSPSTLYGWETTYDVLDAQGNKVGETWYPVCLQEKANCFQTSCDRCIVHAQSSLSNAAEKQELPCSSLFSGGPVPDADGKLYDCGVRLAAGSHGANIGDGISSGRVEVKHNGVWGSVCSTNWGDKEAEVLCKSIGFAGGTARTTASHGCITESLTQCDPAPGLDYDLAVSVGATIDDTETRCMYCNPAGQEMCMIKVVATTADYGAEASWEVRSSSGAVVYSHSFVEDGEENVFARILPPGQLTILTKDSEENGWHPEWEQIVAEADAPGKNTCPLANNGVCEAAMGLTGTLGCEPKADTADCADYCSPFWEQHMGACRVCLSGGVKELGTCTQTAAGTSAGIDCAGVRALSGSTACLGAGSDPGGAPYCQYNEQPCAGGACTYNDCPQACGAVAYADTHGTPLDDSCFLGTSLGNDGVCQEGFPYYQCMDGTDQTDCQGFQALSSAAGETCLGRISSGTREEPEQFDRWDPEKGSVKIFKLSNNGGPCNPSTATTRASTCSEELIQEQWIGTHVGYVDVEHDAWVSEMTYQCGVSVTPTAGDCAYADCRCSTFEQTTCDAPFGRARSDYPIWLGGVDCEGSESSLCSCRQDPASWVWSDNGAPLQWGAGGWLTGCGTHQADAGVVCVGTQQPQPARTKDCSGVCVPASRLGDGWCDSGEFLADFNCEQMQCDSGDCSIGCAPAPIACPAGQWGCDDGTCIDGRKRCDNLPDCADKSDEQQCEGVFCCYDGSQCIPLSWKDDGWPDCLDASDEPAGNYDKYVFNLNNEYCRSVLPMCDAYLQDRRLSCSDTILPNLGCSPVPGADANGMALPPQWNDNVCQPLCGTARCGYDGGDCPAGLDQLACDKRMAEAGCLDQTTSPAQYKCSACSAPTTCAEHVQCSWAASSGSCVDNPDGFYYDGVCDLRFNTTECGYDNGECLKCSWEVPGRDCDHDSLGDGFCDWDCHVPGCDWDEGDCPAVDPNVCPVGYGASSALADGHCDTSFNTASCGCDGGDCSQESAWGDKEIGLETFVCNNGDTVYRHKVCDGAADCNRGEDELTPGGTPGCSAETVCTGLYLYLTTVEYGNEIQFSIDGGPRYGDRTLGAPYGNEIVSMENQNIEVSLTPGSHNITLYDLGGDGWGAGAYLGVMDNSAGGTPALVAGTGPPYFTAQLSGAWSEHTMQFDVGTCAGSTTTDGTDIVMTCADGSSIPRTEVCDGKSDCPGGEDELTGCSFSCNPPNCAKECSSDMLGNGYCEEACFVAACGYDMRDCDECKEGCFDWLLGDGVCNSECANNECLLDGTEDYLGQVTSDCTTADLAWAAGVAQETLSSLRTVRSELALTVSMTYAAALADQASTAYVRLSTQLKGGIASQLGVLETQVT